MEPKNDVSRIRPGILVSCHSVIRGGIKYDRTDLGNEVRPDGTVKSKWETERTIINVEEHERAVKCRSKAIGLIRSTCIPTTFGLLCREDDLSILNSAIDDAKKLIAKFNSSSEFSHVAIYVLKGKVASTDDEAVRSISEEVRSLLDTMEEGISKADVKAIRDACSKAQAITAMLGDEQVRKVSRAVQEARDAAREIVRRVEKRGEEASRVLASIQTRAISNARMAFLDLDDELEVKGAPMPQVNVRNLDIEDEDEQALQAKLAALEAKVMEAGIQ